MIFLEVVWKIHPRHEYCNMKILRLWVHTTYFLTGKYHRGSKINKIGQKMKLIRRVEESVFKVGYKKY